MDTVRDKVRFVILNEVRSPSDEGWQVAYQWGYFTMQEGDFYGFRFMLYENDKMRPRLGQSRILSSAIVLKLVNEAYEQGWGANVAES